MPGPHRSGRLLAGLSQSFDKSETASWTWRSMGCEYDDAPHLSFSFDTSHIPPFCNDSRPLTFNLDKTIYFHKMSGQLHLCFFYIIEGPLHVALLFSPRWGMLKGGTSVCSSVAIGNHILLSHVTL